MPPTRGGGDPATRGAHHQALTDQEGLGHLGDGLGFLPHAERQGGQADGPPVEQGASVLDRKSVV